MKRLMRKEEVDSIYLWLGRSYLELLRSTLREGRYADAFRDTFVIMLIFGVVAAFSPFIEVDMPDPPVYDEAKVYPAGFVRFDSEGGFTVENN